ncbi:MAG TPA: CHASE2 domain-containing protein, partial [Longimicrobiaceae bacterium]|nr:CHASE2 domain-containing protein [Longimicrobiaceae bacterium]
PDERTVALLRRERRELSRALRLLRLRGLVAGAVLAVAGALTALPALRFEGRPLEERLEAYSPWLAGVLVPDPLDSRILLASVTERTQQARGRGFDDPPSLAAWRRDHAAVLDALSRGGARVVVFTQFFESATAGDSALAGAIRRAETRGTRVVLGFRDLEDGRPRLVPGIRDAAGAWGALCMVTRPVPTGWVIPLVIFPDGGSDPSTAVSSLAAAAVTAYHGDHLARLEPSRRRLVYAGAGGERSLAYGHVEPGTNSEGCSALGPDGVAFEGILNSSPRRAFAGTRHRLAYEALLGRNAGREAERARGRIVLVGRDNPANTFPVTTIPVLSRGKEHRYAGELQADAINSVLRGTLLRPLSTLVQFLVTAGLGAAAAAAALHGRARRRRGRGLLLLGGIVAGYLASAALVMVWAHVLLNVWFHLLAIVVSFVVARVIRRRYAL